MDAQLKAKWVEALRSGEFKQGQACLLNKEGAYCCLGMLVKVSGYGIDTYHDRVLWPNGSHDFESSYGPLKDFGIDNHPRSNLIRMNDNSKASFAEIADYIEKNL